MFICIMSIFFLIPICPIAHYDVLYFYMNRIFKVFFSVLGNNIVFWRVKYCWQVGLHSLVKSWLF